MLDVEEVERRVLGCADVAALTAGPGGIGTPIPRGRRVIGVRDLSPGVEVHVVARWGFDAVRLTEAVHAALSDLARPVDIFVDDVEIPDHDPVVVPELMAPPPLAALDQPKTPVIETAWAVGTAPGSAGPIIVAAVAANPAPEEPAPPAPPTRG
jgi:hypothetical protein